MLVNFSRYEAVEQGNPSGESLNTRVCGRGGGGGKVGVWEVQLSRQGETIPYVLSMWGKFRLENSNHR